MVVALTPRTPSRRHPQPQPVWFDIRTVASNSGTCPEHARKNTHVGDLSCWRRRRRARRRGVISQHSTTRETRDEEFFCTRRITRRETRDLGFRFYFKDLNSDYLYNPLTYESIDRGDGTLKNKTIIPHYETFDEGMSEMKKQADKYLESNYA